MLVVLSCNRRVKFKMVAGWFKVKHLELASQHDLSRNLDYPPNGVSPLGAGDLQVFLDESLLDT